MTVILARLLLASALGWLMATPILAAEPVVKPRIGIYDSRALAVAYAGSPVQRKVMAPLRAAHETARQTGDTAAVARLEAQGRAMQEKAHRQAFGTAGVDDLLDLIADALPGIRRAANVDVLVSMWDNAALAKYPGADRVDVTAALVDAFEPTERQRKTVDEIRKKKPLPASALNNARH